MMQPVLNLGDHLGKFFCTSSFLHDPPRHCIFTYKRHSHTMPLPVACLVGLLDLVDSASLLSKHCLKTCAVRVRYDLSTPVIWAAITFRQTFLERCEWQEDTKGYSTCHAQFASNNAKPERNAATSLFNRHGAFFGCKGLPPPNVLHTM